MEPTNFDLFNDNTLVVTISLAEYRFLVQENMRLNHDNELLGWRLAELESPATDEEPEGE